MGVQVRCDSLIKLVCLRILHMFYHHGLKWAYEYINNPPENLEKLVKVTVNSNFADTITEIKIYQKIIILLTCLFHLANTRFQNTCQNGTLRKVVRTRLSKCYSFTRRHFQLIARRMKLQPEIEWFTTQDQLERITLSHQKITLAHLQLLANTLVNVDYQLRSTC